MSLVGELVSKHCFDTDPR
uniref:Uncharacterized protein n=1 Tax=Anguilla anguilla TaxID=7936 RepID=A0A0E9STC9_ANGAN